MAKKPLLSASGLSLTQQNLVFQTVFGIEKYHDGMRYLHIGPQHSEYGRNTSTYRTLWYRMIWDVISPIFAIYRALSHRITLKYQANTLQRKPTTLLLSSIFFGSGSLPPSSLVSRLPFLSSLCCPSDGHILVLTAPPANSNQSPYESAFYLREWLFLCYFLFSFFPEPFYFLLPGTVWLLWGTWYFVYCYESRVLPMIQYHYVVRYVVDVVDAIYRAVVHQWLTHVLLKCHCSVISVIGYDGAAGPCSWNLTIQCLIPAVVELSSLFVIFYTY